MTYLFEHPLLASSLSPASPIVVVAMHRSGTTAVSHILSEVGVQMGIQQDRNREALPFLQVNDIMLHSVEASWLNPQPFLLRLKEQGFLENMIKMARQELLHRFDAFGVVDANQQWGWKDPRTALTIPIWLRLFPRARIIWITRNGIDVALSLKRRAWKHAMKRRKNNIKRLHPINSFIKGFHLWELYCQNLKDVLTDSANSGVSLLQLRYESLVSEPDAQLRMLFDFLSIGVPNDMTSTIAQSKIRRPSRRTIVEEIWVKLACRMNLLDTSALQRFGYSDTSFIK